MISNSVTRATNGHTLRQIIEIRAKRTMHSTPPFSLEKDECETNTDRSTPFAQRTHLWQLKIKTRLGSEQSAIFCKFGQIKRQNKVKLLFAKERTSLKKKKGLDGVDV
jgi:hypothetical protein